MEPQRLDPRPTVRDEAPSALLGHVRDLWRSAPAWRLMVGATSALLVASATTAMLAQRYEASTMQAVAARPELTAPLVPRAANPAPPASPIGPAPNEPACDYRGGQGGAGQGRVVDFLSSEQAARLMVVSQARAHAQINPDYVHNTRVVITVPNGRRVTVLLPPSLVVKPGDRVAFAFGHRDWSMACGYVPNLIIGVLQPQ